MIKKGKSCSAPIYQVDPVKLREIKQFLKLKHDFLNIVLIYLIQNKLIQDMQKKNVLFLTFKRICC